MYMDELFGTLVQNEISVQMLSDQNLLTDMFP